jgi:D-inositol-3-phosphate glycosyltransferase
MSVPSHDPSLVVHSCTSLSFSGLERYVLDLAEWQYRQGKPVELFCREGSELFAEAKKRNLPTWTIPKDLRWGPKLWAKMLAGWRQRTAGGNVALHMHAGGEPWYHLPWLLKRPAGLKRAVLHYHIWINHKKRDPVHWAVFRAIDEIWTSSETARAHLASLLPVARGQIRVVPYGRDLKQMLTFPLQQWRQTERAKLGLTEKDVLAVCVSRIEPIKGIGELFDAFVELAKARPDIHLAVVGDVSPDNQEAEDFWANIQKRYASLEKSVQGRLRFLGYLPNCFPVMAAADFYVLPSYEECMSLALLDALILGLPVVGTNSGGTPSVARPGETGVLVAPRDAQSLKKGLIPMFEDAQLRRKLSEGARELGPKFDREQVFQDIWAHYSA